jgi:hypothetical protein
MTMGNSGAGFSTSAGARNVANGLNPLSPGGMSPKNTHLPTLGWAVIAVVVAFVVYHYVIKKGR